MFKTLKEINARKLEIRSLLESNADCNIDDLEKELRELDEKAQPFFSIAQAAAPKCTCGILSIPCDA